MSRQSSITRLRPPLAVVALLAVTAACSEQAGTLAGPPSPGDDVLASGGTLTGFHVTVCVDPASPSGMYTFDRSADSDFGTFFASSPFELGSGDCVDVWQDDEDDPSIPGDPFTDVTVEETAPAAGAVLDEIQFTDDFNAATSSGSTATVTVNWFHGGTITFVHSAAPGGGEGCTPGYWRQSQHFDSWPAPYVPVDTDTDDATLLTDVFTIPEGLELRRPERSDPEDLTLLEGVTLRGGGVNALIRHAVAALLNAASPDVSYDLSVGDVVGDFDAAVAGGDVEGAKDAFEGFNEQGCPLD